LSPVAVRLVERGHLGQKSGSGVYRYQPGSHTAHDSPITEAIAEEVRRENGRPRRSFTAESICERLILRMVGEAFWVLEEHIVRRPSDLDVAMVLGTGFPDFRGGVWKYAHDQGLDRVRGRLEELTQECGRRFAPCRLLQEQEGV
jgi:3-hydroxyacyl-CoA dehydrogenase